VEKPRSDVFLSHATPDKPVVEELATKLRREGIEPWLDIWNLIPGEPWQEAIEEALATCATCAVLIGPGGTGPWQNEEMRTAIDRRVSSQEERFRVIPVLLPNASRGEPSRFPDFLRNATWVEFRESLDDEKALHRLVSGIRGLAPGPGPGGAVAEGAIPYRGLEFFDVGDSKFFFGREVLTGWLLDKLLPGDSANRFLAIVGASGSGKSSLARAGLLAALQRGELPGSEAWPHVILKPGARPLENLAVALAGAAGPGAVSDLIGKLGSDPRMVHLTARVALRKPPAGRRLVLLVDQFEEVFTLCSDEKERRSFLDNLLYAATTADGPTAVILTLRADFYARCATYPDLAAAVSDRQILVGPMTRDELQSAIERPAHLAGRELEGGLADLLLNEVEAHPGSLPLLEHALLEIWKECSPGRLLTVEAYREIGGVLGALEKHAEKVYGKLSTTEQEACRQVFLQLVQVDEQGRATRRRLDRSGLAAACRDRSAAETVITRLTDERLLTTGQELAETVEVAHEALLSGWKRLRDWIEQDRESLQTRRRLGEAVEEWKGKNQDPSYLYRGARLLRAEEWSRAHPGEAGPDAETFLAAGRAEEDAESRRALAEAEKRAREQARARKGQRNWAIGFAAVAVAASVALVVALLQFRESEKGRRTTLANELGGKSQFALEQENPALALLLGIEAVRQAERGGHRHLPGAENPLRKALSFFRGDPLPTGKIRTADLSFDRRWMGLAGTDGMLSLWQLTEKGPVRAAFWRAGASAEADQIAVGNDGRWMLVRAAETSRLFEVNPSSGRARAILELAGESWRWYGEPFSPDGRWLLTETRPGSWIVRSLERPSHVIAKLPLTPRAVTAFSPDGRWLAVADPDVRIGETSTFGGSSSLQLIPGGAALPSIEKLAFSSDSRWLVAASGSEFSAWKLPLAFENHPLSFSLKFRIIPNEWKPMLQDASLVSGIPRLLQARFSGEINAVALDPETGRAVGSESPWPRSTTTINIYKKGKGRAVASWNETNPIGFISLQGQSLILLPSWFGPPDISREPPRVLELPLELPPDFDIADLGAPIVRKEEAAARGLPDEWRLKRDPERLNAAFSQLEMLPLNGGEPTAFSSDGEGFAFVGPDGAPVALRSEADRNTWSMITFPVQCPHSQPWYIIALSQKSEWLFTGNSAGESCLWSLSTPSKPRALPRHEGGVMNVAFRSDGRQIATADEEGVVRVRELAADVAPKDLPNSPRFGRSRFTALAFLSDGRLAIGLDSAPAKLWRPGHPETFELGGSSSTTFLVASANGNHVATGTSTGIEVWVSEEGELPSTPIRLPSLDAVSLTFSEDGSLWSDEAPRLTGLEETLRRWELQTNKLLDTACRAVGRNLTEREWKTYLPSEKYTGNQPCPIFGKAFD
jgi:WD40 repeat protein